MADNTQKQTAATAAAPGSRPDGAARTQSTVTPHQGPGSKELDLDSLLAAELGGGTVEEPDPELDADLPGKSKSKPDAQDTSAEEEAETETDTSDEDEQETDEADSEETAEEEEETSAAAEIGDDEEVDPEKPPKGFENVPKGIWKRQNKLIKAQRELKAQLAQGAIQITPTPEHPLADVDTLEALNTRVSIAKSVRDWVRANPDGGSMPLSNGKTVEIDEPTAKARLAMAEAILDAAPDIKLRLAAREQSKPWEKAQTLEPTLFDKAHADHTFLAETLSQAPGLADHPEWELIMAYAAKGRRIALEEQAKKARYVRYELDKDGKLIAPKAAAGKSKQAPAKAAPAAKPPAPPSSTRPPLATRPGTQQQAATKAAQRAMTGSDADVAASLAAELGDF